jgi:oligoendopeptidase F
MGGSRYPLDELKHAGVDLTTPEPVETALKKFERLLDDAERTAAKLGY